MSTYTMSRTTPRVRIAERALQPSGTTRRALNGEEYDHRFVASTELLASDGGVILVGAWGPGLPAYMRRPRWIANHDIGGFAKLTDVALGRGVWAGIESGLPETQAGPSGRGLVVYVKYARTPFAQEVRTLYEDGGLDDVSVRWDWRTEVLREPTAEERAAHGQKLAWVATRADLVELSAVMLGADPGAQVIRSDVVAAFERCRGKGLALPEVERLCRGGACVPGWREPEPAAAADTIDSLQQASGALDAWLNGVGPIRQQLADAVTALQNLAATAASDAPPEKEQPDEVSAWLNVLSEALIKFDLALRDVAPAVGEVGDAVKRLANRGFVLDVAAVLRDVQRRRKPAGSRGVETFTIGGREVEIDLDKVLADAAKPRRQAGRSGGVERVTIGDKEYVLDIAAIRRDLRRR